VKTCFFVVFCLTCAAARAFDATVIGVPSGDTVILQKGTRLHLEGVDAPELPVGQLLGQPFANHARNALQRLIQGRHVSVDIVYAEGGRLYAVVYADGVCVNTVLAGTGLVYPMESADPYLRRKIDQAVREAQEQQLGIWSLRTLEYPWQYRAKFRTNHR